MSAKRSIAWVGTCVNLKAEDLEAYDDSSRNITYRTFLRRVGGAIVREVNQQKGFPIGKDWHVTFSKGKWKGEPALCMMHSGIHHIWTV